MSNFFYYLFYRPIFNILIILCIFCGGDLGLAIIALTIFIRIILLPLSIGAVSSQKKLLEIQPQVQEIQKKYKEDKEKQATLLLEIYKKEKINPFLPLLLLLIQLPILIALYRVIASGLYLKDFSFLYSFIPHPGRINLVFLGILDLTKPYLLLTILASLTQYFQSRFFSPSPKKEINKRELDFSQIIQRQTQYFLPLLTIAILFKLPSALALYWTTNNFFSIIQQYFVFKKREKTE